MLIRQLIEEDFVNYKKPSLFLGIGTCNWKCCIEASIPITTCQNSELAESPEIEISTEDLFRRYSNNSITTSVVIGGLEPLTRWNEVVELIKYFRKSGCNDDFIIYTGFKKEEIQKEIEEINGLGNIIFKFGRFKPDEEPHFDEVLGIKLCSDNQKGEQVC